LALRCWTWKGITIFVEPKPRFMKKKFQKKRTRIGVNWKWTVFSLFKWYSQSMKILLNLSMKCWNSPFNAQGWRLYYISRSNENICRNNGGTHAKKNMIKLNLPPKLCWRHVNDLKHPLTVVSMKSNYMHKWFYIPNMFKSDEHYLVTKISNNY